jgi:hypothetical protein
MIGAPPICLFCSRLSYDKETPICPAFPKGIPDGIYLGAFDHRKAFKGDQGIRFELMAGKDDALKTWTRLREKRVRRTE